MRKKVYYLLAIVICFIQLQLYYLPKLYADNNGIQPSLLENEQDSEKQFWIHFDNGHKFLNLAYENYEEKTTQEVNTHLYEAYDQFTQALVYLPNDVSALINRAHISASLQKYDEALIDYKQALTIQPDAIAALEGKVMVYEKLSQFEQAEVTKNLLENAEDAKLAAQNSQNQQIPPEDMSSPNGNIYVTTYSMGIRHNYRNRITGVTHPNELGFACGVYNPIKTDVENIAYFNLPLTSWSRLVQAQRRSITSGLALYWDNISHYTHRYVHTAPWTPMPGANYFVLIQERDVCGGWYAPLGTDYKISYWTNN